MYIVLTSKNFNVSNIYFNKPIENNIIENCKFIRIGYSNKYFDINNLYINTPFIIKNTHYCNFYKKYKLIIERKENINLIKYIENIEKNIIDKFCNLNNLKPIYKLSNQLHNDFIKLYFESKTNTIINTNNKCNIKFKLKISGIWSNNNQAGITYKFV